MMNEVDEPADLHLPLKTLYLVDVFFDLKEPGRCGNSKRVLASGARAVIDVLNTPGVVGAQMHVLRGHVPNTKPDDELVSAVSEVYVAAYGVFVYSLESGEKYLVNGQGEPTPLHRLLYTGPAPGDPDKIAVPAQAAE
ncbi:hypothetical protein B0G80_5922 [Paraburkholderia sp. BL6669N2]|uniref:hypothetical protein n=1 Tax=Paraburkholderia sp. BL6669N2 TaxID=1938807 RepID=UPI000E2375C1|nr:hypothetical protein [Paraburkholderia sp. BL6669N2]REG49548.1 hypothetical protein B0G80_5922 [Paraburkholderia sp. BL6669N2]